MLDPRVAAWAARRRLKGLAESMGMTVESILQTPARTVEAWLTCEALYADWTTSDGSSH